MKPTTRYKLIPQVQFITTVELDDQQVATLNRLVLADKSLTDDQALDLWLSLNPYIQVCNHANPRDIFSSLRYARPGQATSHKPKPQPPYPAELLNSVRSDIETDGQNFICC